MNDCKVTIGIPTYNRANLLGDAIESALEQSYREFRLVISDNASTDKTKAVVAAFSDPRIEYLRLSQNIGMIGNFNRIIETTDTEFLMLLPDDDRLYPEYLTSVVKRLERYPTVGVVHTAFDEIDIESRVQKHAVSFVNSRKPPSFEPGRVYLERSMTSIAVCFSTATYRTRAILEAGGMLTREEPFADVPLFMRIATNWDFAYIDRPLVGFRLHDETETRRLVLEAGEGRDARDRLLTYGQVFFDRRIGFLDRADLPSGETKRYRALATLCFVADRGGLGVSWSETTTRFLQVVRLYPRILLHPTARRLVVAHLGGRQLRRAARWVPRVGVALAGPWRSRRR